MVTCKVFFNKSNKKYKAGDMLQLKIILNVTKQFKARLLSVRFLGEAHTEWQVSRTVTENNQSRTVYDTYTANEEYFRRYKNLLGQQGGDSFKVEPGNYEYNVSFDLPESLPSSFEHSYGYIRYGIKINYDVAWGFNETFKETFMVQSKVDLNTDSYLREPIKTSVEKTFGCCCWESDPLDLVTRISRRTWVPGESMLIDVEVHNDSDVKIEFVTVKLKEKLNFITNSPSRDTKSESNTIKEYKFPESVAPYQKKIFKCQLALDLNHDWKIFTRCGIIMCNYSLETEAESSGCHTNLDSSVIVLIGTEPLINLSNDTSALTTIPPYPSAPLDVVMEQPLPSYDEVSSNHVPSSSSMIGWAVDDDAPPTFEESEKLKQEKHSITMPETGPTAPPQ